MSAELPEDAVGATRPFGEDAPPSMLDPRRCACYVGNCPNLASIPGGLCPTCAAHYAAQADTFKTPDAWG